MVKIMNFTSFVSYSVFKNKNEKYMVFCQNNTRKIDSTNKLAQYKPVSDKKIHSTQNGKEQHKLWKANNIKEVFKANRTR